MAVVNGPLVGLVDFLWYHVAEVGVELYRCGFHGLKDVGVVEGLLQYAVVVYWAVEVETVRGVVLVVYYQWA